MAPKVAAAKVPTKAKRGAGPQGKASIASKVAAMKVPAKKKVEPKPQGKTTVTSKIAATKVPTKTKAEAKPEAQIKAKRAYRFWVHVPAPAPLRTRNQQRHLAMLARPGSWRLCPQCGYPHYVPNASTCHYACAMPRVPLPGGDTIRKCDFQTSAQGWRRRDILHLKNMLMPAKE